MSPLPSRRAVQLTLALTILVVGMGSSARLAAAPPPRGHRSAEAWLRKHLDRLAADRRLGGARVGLAVIAIDSGRTLATREADRASPVASNVKLVTAAAALAYLGPAYRFRTAVYAPAREGAVVTGPLLLKGFGDPTLAERDLWRLACSVYDAGVREIRGGLLLDESFFDGQRLAPLYETRKTDMYYRPLVAPISIHENAVSTKVFGGATPGAPTRLVVRPRSSYFKVVNRTTTVGRRRRSYLDVRTGRSGKRTELRVTGRVRVNHSGRWHRRRIEHPARLAGQTLLDLLARRGVKLRSARVGRGKVARRLKPLALHRSPPLGTVVRYMTKTSSNFVAEMLLKVLGAEIRGGPGSWRKGLEVTGRYLTGLRIAPGTYQMKNGSGLYEGNRFSARQLVTVLRAAASNFRYGADFVAALATAGVDGTLTHRFLGTGAEGYVRAKTGTLAAVVSLSGIAGAQARRERLAFSFLVTELPAGHILRARRVVDEMATALVTYLERPR